jgi:hypothetical protein
MDFGICQCKIRFLELHKSGFYEKIEKSVLIERKIMSSASNIVWKYSRGFGNSFDGTNKFCKIGIWR